MVSMESLVSGHRINKIRERLADKLEIIQFDPKSKYITAINCQLKTLSNLQDNLKYKPFYHEKLTLLFG